MGQRIISTEKRQVPRQNKSQTKTFTPKQSVRTQYSNTTNRQKRMEKGKGKAQRSQPKTITAVQAMKQEMLRRAHEAAAKYVDVSVAFCPADEEWMPCSIYPDVGSAFLLGVVARYNITSTKTSDGISQRLNSTGQVQRFNLNAMFTLYRRQISFVVYDSS
ncbi:Hypothetical protein PHPALM_37565 [Phytophthora palmivora]|uniref:Uncharacterized protein n=1 Tax=Phytophthora palmivora TaxID=4796 RepID=A0A2P4WX66_9STRA|nr:Hypothetical protein PHPALM_37565 [Phytophthora palmivora]